MMLERLFGVNVQELGETALLSDSPVLSEVYNKAISEGKDKIILNREERRIYQHARKNYREMVA